MWNRSHQLPEAIRVPSVSPLHPGGRIHDPGAQRIALFMPTLGGGGAERVMLTLAKGFVESGHAVDLVVASAQGELRATVPVAVRLVDLQLDWHVDNFQPLAAYLRRRRPAALVSALSEANCMAIRAREAAAVDTRVAVTEHSTLSRIAGSQGAHLPALVGAHYRRADAVVAVSIGVADDLAVTAGLDRDRVSVVYNPVEADRIAGRSAAAPDHPWLAAGQPPVVLAVGRLAPAKDYPTLLRAFARLHQRRPARLLILGEGPGRRQLQQLASSLGVRDAVSMPGFVANPYPYMRRAAVLALASRWEGLPTVLLEALACNAAIVATDCPSGPAEILEGGKWGRLVPVGDDHALAAALERVLGERHARRDGLPRARFFSLQRAVQAYGRKLGLRSRGLPGRPRPPLRGADHARAAAV